MGRIPVGQALLSMLLALVLGLAGFPGERAAAEEKPALAVITLRAEAEVAGPRVLLGQIAHIEASDPELRRALENLDVRRAPIPGQVVYLNEPRIRVALRRARLPEKEIVIHSAAEQVAITLGRGRRGGAPREVLAAAVDLPRHQPLSPDVVEVVAHTPSSWDEDLLTPEDVSPEELTNWRTRRSIRAGTPLQLSRLEPTPHAARGSRVTVEVRYGAVEIVAPGTMEHDAWVGDTVRVRVEGSGQVVSGRLVAPERVEIIPAGLTESGSVGEVAP